MLHLDFLFMTLAALKSQLKWLGSLVAFIFYYKVFGGALIATPSWDFRHTLCAACSLSSSWCVLVVLECLSSPRVAFSLVRVDYSDFWDRRVLFYYPSASLSQWSSDWLCVGYWQRQKPGSSWVVMRRLQINLCSLPVTLFLGMLTSCFDNQKWVYINWGNALAHLHMLYEPMRQLPPSSNWELGE